MLIYVCTQNLKFTFLMGLESIVISGFCENTFKGIERKRIIVQQNSHEHFFLLLLTTREIMRDCYKCDTIIFVNLYLFVYFKVII